MTHHKLFQLSDSVELTYIALLLLHVILQFMTKNAEQPHFYSLSLFYYIFINVLRVWSCHCLDIRQVSVNINVGRSDGSAVAEKMIQCYGKKMQVESSAGLSTPGLNNYTNKYDTAKSDFPRIPAEQ